MGGVNFTFIDGHAKRYDAVPTQVAGSLPAAGYPRSAEPGKVTHCLTGRWAYSYLSGLGGSPVDALWWTVSPYNYQYPTE